MKYFIFSLLILCHSFTYAQTTPDDIRLAIAKGIADLKVTSEPVASIKNDFVFNGKDSIHIRIYKPSSKITLPVVYYVHGGGWVAGDLETHDNACRYFTNSLQAIVVAVDYRRPPEHKFPIPFDDTYLVFKWIYANMKDLNGNGKLIVMGESAGGQLAASICLVNAIDKNPIPVIAEVLVIPALNLAKGFASYKRYPYFIDWYLNDTDSADDIRISPLLSKDVSKVPPTIIVVGETDPIRSDGEEYNKKLVKAGIVSPIFIQPNFGHFALQWCAADKSVEAAFEFVVSKLKELYVK